MFNHRKISGFNPGHEYWTSCAEQLGSYFAANQINDEAKKKAILLTIYGHSTFQLLKSLPELAVFLKPNAEPVEKLDT